MEIRNHATDMNMRPALFKELQRVRGARGFNAQYTVAAKAMILNDYLRRSGLKSVVVAVSGGIDSAVVLGIAARAMRAVDSPIEKIIAISLPSHGTEGVTGQALAQSDAKVVANAFGVELAVVDMHPIVQSIIGSVEEATGLHGNIWAEGQVVSYARTPTYYYVTSLLAAMKLPGVVLGTTNLSEGGYLGYFGKASDGMVDVQMISDLYKREVYACAEELLVPARIIDKAPTGDMFDACEDEVVFGAPYDFVELYQENLRNPVKQTLEGDDLAQYEEYAANLERMHAYNGHKYLAKSPAVHLDLMPCAVPGGWDNRPPELEIPAINEAKLVNHQPLGLFTPAVMSPAAKHLPRRGEEPVEWPEARAVPIHNIRALNSGVKQIQHFLPEWQADALARDVMGRPWKAVPKDGIAVKGPLRPEDVGSLRLTVHNQRIADDMWERLQPHIKALKVCHSLTPTDHDDHPVWRPVGVSPVFRFIRYKPGHMLIPHYDATFIENDRRRTLQSLVIYLNNTEGGQTRFIEDPQASLPVKDRDLSDWKREPTEDEILFQFEPETGLAILFDHRILHDGAKIEGSHEKLILRTDVIFERCDWYAPGR